MTNPTYNSIDELLDDMEQDGILGKFANQTQRSNRKASLNFSFNNWLQDHKKWMPGNAEQYKGFLNEDTFLEFLKFYKAENKKRVETTIAKQNARKERRLKKLESSADDPERQTRQDDEIGRRFALTYCTDNSLEFQGKKIYFPFPCHDVSRELGSLLKLLLSVEVSHFTLQDYRYRIFVETGLIEYPEHAAIVCNIIGTWISEMIKPIHKGKKDDALNGFMEYCEALVKEAQKERNVNLKAELRTEAKTELETFEPKPTLKSGSVQEVFETIKDFFNAEQQSELKLVLETGRNAVEKLLFKGQGNRLTDTLKKLFEHDFIIGCQKKDLIKWIVANFNYVHQNRVKSFVYNTVEKTISKRYSPCKNPLIEIRNGQIEKVVQPQTKRYRH